MPTNYIYLLQEREHIRLNEEIYKIGRTKQEDLKRFKQYPKGSKLLLYQVCDDCDNLEKELIKEFKNKYIHRKDIGNEYFEGQLNDMIKDINIKTYISNDVVHNEDTDNENTDNEENKPEIEINDDVKILFPNYYEDETFGGTKKLIKIYIEIHKIIIIYIDCEKNDCNDTQIHNYMVKEHELNRYEWEDNWNSEKVKYIDNYYNNIIKYKVIEDDKIYDLDDVGFIRRLDKYKHSIKLHYSDKLDYITDKYRLHFKEKLNLIEFYIQNNAILNDVIYCGLIEDICYIQFHSQDGVEKLNDTFNTNTFVDFKIHIKRINSFGFDFDYLEQYTPYCINTNDDEYYMLNRNYKGITTGEAYTMKDYKQIYLHKGNECPWVYDEEKEIKLLYNKLSETLKKTTTNKICKNENKHTNIILTKCI